MVKKKIKIKHSDLVNFITETALEATKQIINEQGTDLDLVNLKGKLVSFRYSKPLVKANITEEEAWKTWNSWTHDTRTKLKNGTPPIQPYTVIPVSTFKLFGAKKQQFILPYLYRFDPPTALLKNLSLAKGDSLYQFIPGMRTYYLDEVQICFSKRLDTKVCCKTGKPFTEDCFDETDPNEKMTGFEVTDSGVLMNTLFGHDTTDPMNTKYFCKPYILQATDIPQDVREEVLDLLQLAFSKIQEVELDINEEDWYDGKEEALTDINEKLLNYNDWEILKIVSDYFQDRVTTEEAGYHAGRWKYRIGDNENKESIAELDAEAYQKYFNNLKSFAQNLLKTDCGYGVGDTAMSDMTSTIEKKYGDLIKFAQHRPENWNRMSPAEQQEWLDGGPYLTDIEKQDAKQSVWDWISIGFVVVAAVLAAIPSGGSSLAVGSAIAMGIGTGMGVASSIYDLHQGQTTLGTIGLTLELVPYVKLFRLAGPLSKIPTKEVDKMFTYALKNGPDALKTSKQFSKYGPEMFKILKANSGEMGKIISKYTKDADGFLKRFATMDPAEYYALQMLSPNWRAAFKSMDFKVFKKGLNEMSDIVFAANTKFAAFFKALKYNLSVPAKTLLANLIGWSGYHLRRCWSVDIQAPWFLEGFDAPKTVGVMNSKDNPQAMVIPSEISWINIKLHADSKGDMGCQIVDALYSKLFGVKTQLEMEYIEEFIEGKIEELSNGGDVEIDTTDGNIDITITNPNFEGDEPVKVSIWSPALEEDIFDNFDGSLKGFIQAYVENDDIRALMVNDLGEGDIAKGEKELQRVINGLNPDTVDDQASTEWWEMLDRISSNSLFIENKPLVEARHKELAEIYE